MAGHGSEALTLKWRTEVAAVGCGSSRAGCANRDAQAPATRRLLGLESALGEEGASGKVKPGVGQPDEAAPAQSWEARQIKHRRRRCRLA